MDSPSWEKTNARTRYILTGHVGHLRVDESVSVIDQFARIQTGVAVDKTVERQRVSGHADAAYIVKILRYPVGAAVVASVPDGRTNRYSLYYVISYGYIYIYAILTISKRMTDRRRLVTRRRCRT